MTHGRTGRGGKWLGGIAAAALCLGGASLAQAQAGDGRPQVRIAPRILVEADIETPLMVHIGPADAVPARSYIQLRGLPEAAILNDGHSVSPGVWAVPLRSLGTLSLTAPQTAVGTSDFVVRVISVDGAVLGEARSTLIIAQGFQISPRAAAPAPPPPEPRPAAAPPRASTVTPVTPPPPPQAARAEPERQRAVLPADERLRLEKLVANGNRHLGTGNIAAAREFFRRAAEGGLADGALLLASTYDPAELSAIKVQGLAPDPAEARRWYERARELGAAGVDARISRLGAR